LVAAAVLLVLFLALMWRVGAAAGAPKLALERVTSQRGALRHAVFLTASSSGKARGPGGESIQWREGGGLGGERQTRRLAALVGVTIAFDAVAGGEMEGVAAVGNLRHGSATFFYHRGAWHAAGKTIFNLLPDEAVERFAAQYERVEG